jgi:hypothetical protein
MTRIAAALLVLPLLFGCGPKPRIVSLTPPEIEPRAADYYKVYERWTRHGGLRSDFDVALDVDATFKGPEFRAAYAEKYLEIYRVTPSAAPKVRAEQYGVDDGYEFHLVTIAHSWELNDFTTSKTVWRLALINDHNEEVTPSEVKLLRDRLEKLAVFYPTIGIFSKSWRIRFPKTHSDGQPFIGPGATSITLRISGPPGSIDLIWKLR